MELYIHIPFCVRKCNYCDFLSFPCDCPENDGRMTDYVEALCDELTSLKDRYSGAEFTSAFIGGGTPSLLPAELMERVLQAASRLMVKAPAEYTIECNPGTVDADKLALYRKYGINRISFGLQSVNDEELKMLGRIHDYGQFLESYRLAREAGFDNINVDLISAIPGQTTDSWERTLRTVAELKPQHISAYSLIIEPGTRFWDIYGDDGSASVENKATDNIKFAALPDEDAEREMYGLTARVLEEYGFGRYEISNYALPGRESLHNIGYWTGEEYLGAGLGASSYITDGGSGAVRFRNTDDMEKYLRPVDSGGRGSERVEEERIDADGMMSEYMILHLRLTAGLETEDFRKKFGVDVNERYGEIIKKYISGGFIRNEGGRLMLTEKGLDVSNMIMAEFI